jgi:hypothetical protein
MTAVLRPKVTSLAPGLLLHDVAVAAVVVVAVAALAITVVYQWLSLTHRFPLDYGEAPLVDQAMRLAAGHNIYKPDLSAPPYTISNYPPLYVALLAPWVRLFGPSFAEGRFLSIVCAWISGACLAVIVYRLHRDRWAGALAGLAFVTLPYATHWSAFLRVDMLALALSLLALTVLVRWPAARWSLLAAGALLVASIYTRQSYALAAPLAAACWLWLGARAPRRAVLLGVLVAGACLALFLLLQAATHDGFFFNIVTANANEYRMDILTNNARDVGRTCWPLLGLALVALALGPRRLPLYALAVPYLVGGALSALTIGKIGSNVNYLLELCAGLTLAAGSVLSWTRQPDNRRWLAAGVLLLLGVQIGLSARTTLTRYAGELGDRRALTKDLYRLETMVAQAQGPVLADEYMGLLTLEARPLYMQPFEVTQLAWAGDWDQTGLLESLAQQQFDMILIYDRPWSRERWTPEMLEAISSHYRLSARLADTMVYEPYDGSAPVPVEACAGAPWRLPASAERGLDPGLEPMEDGLVFLGGGIEGVLPVVAVADGLLTRQEEWAGVVVIEHDDPLHPGEKVWTAYTDMSSSNWTSQYIAPEFPPGSQGVPVTAGQVIGYQGGAGRRQNWPTWVHMRFFVLRGTTPGQPPEDVTPDLLLDPAPYLGLAPEITAPGAKLQPLRCAGQ